MTWLQKPFCGVLLQVLGDITLPETNVAPENRWLEYDRFLVGWPIFRGEPLVPVRVGDFFVSLLLTFETFNGIC